MIHDEALARPPRGLAGPHAQTLLSSTVRKALVRRRAAAFRGEATRVVVTARDGARLEAWVNEPDPAQRARPAGCTHPDGCAGVVVIHGWLGSATSGYTLGASLRLHRAGFATARLNLRDHGDTAHLNEELFNSARLDEVLDAVRALTARWPAAGVLGYSLGGNFALRIARATGLPTLAICPALDPALTLARIDGGARVYRRYFVAKWRRALAAKEAAFPDRYDFAHARRLETVTALTDWFVAHHSNFASATDYFSRYDLTGRTLDGAKATILATRDDPVILPRQFDGLPAGIEVRLTPRGGHCAFLRNWRLESAADDWAVAFFEQKLLQRSRTGSGKSRYSAN